MLARDDGPNEANVGDGCDAPHEFASPQQFALLIIDDAPRVGGQSLVLDEDTQISGAATADVPGGGEVSFTLAQPAESGAASVAANGDFSYTPDNDFAGFDRFLVTATANGETSLPAVVELQVNQVNDPPVLADLPDIQEYAEAFNNPVIPGFASVTSLGAPDEGFQAILEYQTTVDDPDGLLGQLSINQQGDLEYAYNGAEGAATVTVRARDSGGGNDLSAPRSFVIRGDYGLDLALSAPALTTLALGDVRTLRVQVQNLGPSVLRGGGLRSAAPSGLAIVEWRCEPAAFCSTASGSGAVDITVSELFDQQSFELVLDLRASAAQGETAPLGLQSELPGGVINLNAANDSLLIQAQVVDPFVFEDGFEPRP